jgi:hypothetical protein
MLFVRVLEERLENQQRHDMQKLITSAIAWDLNNIGYRFVKQQGNYG